MFEAFCSRNVELQLALFGVLQCEGQRTKAHRQIHRTRTYLASVFSVFQRLLFPSALPMLFNTSIAERINSSVEYQKKSLNLNLLNQHLCDFKMQNVQSKTRATTELICSPFNLVSSPSCQPEVDLSAPSVC